jgi:transcriptional regulator with XRE-family HTH domain
VQIYPNEAAILPSNQANALADFFRDLRLSRGHSPETLARLAGLPLRQIALLEEGGAEKISLSLIHSVLNELNVSEEEFTRFTQLVEEARVAAAPGRGCRQAT